MLTARTTTSTRSSGSSSAPTTTSRSRSTRARSSPGSRRSSGGPTRRARRPADRGRRPADRSRAGARRPSASGDSSSAPREFDLLAALARDPGVVLTRDALLEDVWGTDFPGETRTVDVHVAEVRKKLGAGRAADRDRPRRRLPPVPPAREPLPPATQPTPPDRSPRALAGRIWLASPPFAPVASRWSRRGALFVVLRGAPRRATTAALADVGQRPAFRPRSARPSAIGSCGARSRRSARGRPASRDHGLRGRADGTRRSRRWPTRRPDADRRRRCGRGEVGHGRDHCDRRRAATCTRPRPSRRTGAAARAAVVLVDASTVGRGRAVATSSGRCRSSSS